VTIRATRRRSARPLLRSRFFSPAAVCADGPRRSAHRLRAISSASPPRVQFFRYYCHYRLSLLSSLWPLSSRGRDVGGETAALYLLAAESNIIISTTRSHYIYHYDIEAEHLYHIPTCLFTHVRFARLTTCFYYYYIHVRSDKAVRPYYNIIKSQKHTR